MAVDAEEAGMDAFMDKPFKLEELTAVYTKLLERNHRNQRDIPTHQSTGTPGVDTDPSSLGTAARGPRSIRKVTPNAKIFVDANELMVGDTSPLEQVGTFPIAAVAVLDWKHAKTAQQSTSEHFQTSTGTGDVSGNDMVSGIMSNNAKVHAAN